MSSLQLLNSAFKRICVFMEKFGFKIRNTKNGIAFYSYPDAKLFNYDWIWRNKKELMIGCIKNDDVIEASLFSLLISAYEFNKRYNINNSKPISEPNSKSTLDLINVCQSLKDCYCIEELVIKMDLMGI